MSTPLPPGLARNPNASTTSSRGLRARLTRSGPVWAGAILAGAVLAALPAAASSAAATSVAVSTSSRPLLDAASAADYTPQSYLGDWRPAEIEISKGQTPTFAVGPDSAFTTVQSAVTAAVAAGGGSRVYIAVTPGTYREVVCVPVGAPPITLYGTSRRAERTVIVFDHANPMPKDPTTASNGCTRGIGSATYGTSGSATFSAFAAQFQAANLTIANDYVEGTYASSNQSAVALYAQGDQQVYQNVRVLGNQDTLLSGTSGAGTVARHFFHESTVAGDTDFVFGRGTAVFDEVTFEYDSSRRTDGVIFAPSTAAANPYGFLVVKSRFTVSGAASGTVRLGRAWDESVGPLAAYVNGVSPNGQLVIRDSRMAAHLMVAAPWGPSTIGRPFCVGVCTYSPNRFFEYRNTGPGSAA
jgi:pectinesterase